MELIKQYLPLLIPVVLIELGLMVIALVDLIRRSRTRGPKWVWVLVIVLINFIGPIIYFVAGRQEE
ncbi:MAG: PLD nuclease N-terminal domain-containing protein [Anaerolineales bacterium]|jgi:hypothetical protein